MRVNCTIRKFRRYGLVVGSITAYQEMDISGRNAAVRVGSLLRLLTRLFLP